jgi:transmembrane sensor
MKRNVFLKLLSQKISGEISEAANQELVKAIDRNPAYKEIASELMSNKAESTADLASRELEKIWTKIDVANESHTEKFDFNAPKKLAPYTQILKIAAILLLLIGAAVSSYQLLYRSNNKLENIATGNEKTFKVLDDGTKIWLNKQSTISYNQDFGKRKREIFLTGEAYFDVVKNKAIPLFIHAGNINIEVKGTAFNINAYKNQPQIQVSLLRGSIQITEKSNKIPLVLLRPNEKFIYKNSLDENGNPRFYIVSVPVHKIVKEVKWIADTLVFKKEKLKDLALKMEIKYNSKIEIQSERLKEKRFSGTFTDETLQQALEALKLSYPLTYTINNKLVVIKD